MQKKIIAKIKVLLPGGNATVGGPISAKFAFYKINSALFIKEYNERTKHQLDSTIPAIVTIFDDKSFSFETKTCPTSELLLKILKLEKGSKFGKKEIIKEISYDDILKIATIKLPDLNTLQVEKAVKCIIGTAINMGIKII